MSVLWYSFPVALQLIWLCGLGLAEDYVPKPGEFPPPGASGRYLAGELVSVDHVNRRGAIRLVGDNDDDRYHIAPSHRFAMLPYGTLRYHGAPAELRDIPIGTVLHGYFFLPIEGDVSLPPPAKDAGKYVSPYTHALTLEDDFSFNQRRGRAWKVLSVDPQQGKLQARLDAPATADGIKGEQTFELDVSTRVWSGRQIGELKDITPEQVVQLNLSWAPDWKNGQFYIADIWIDDESRNVAAEIQRQIHIRHQRHRWLAGWVDHVEHRPGGKGTVTLTLFGGMDGVLYDQAKSGGGVAIAAAESTLRTWWQNNDSKNGPIVDVQQIDNPPPGSSGLQLRVELQELLEGFRPGRIIRLRPYSFPNSKPPPEERVKSLDDR